MEQMEEMEPQVEPVELEDWADSLRVPEPWELMGSAVTAEPEATRARREMAATGR
jgi:hypothetical protein